ncbi:M12 family metallo-peptidase [Thioalkalivibrio paradoxus]|uniref:M12 family metallo-peptidase n=1 Tax=Thioalkalivibrio paradoxus TaxID=108010 RepID=UPI00022C1571|nr:M12 family metallo-peptidase [Thioalkalivibrio paradoxus]
MMFRGGLYCGVKRALSGLFTTLLLVGAAAASAFDRVEIENHRAELDRLLSESAPSWRLRQIEIEGRGTFDFDLRSVDVFAPDARVVIDNGTPLPHASLNRTRHLRGRVRGIEGSLVTVSVAPDGRITGLLNDGEVTWELQRRPWDEALEATRLDVESVPAEPFRCQADRLVQPTLLRERQLQDFQHPRQLPVPAALPEGQLYEVTVALETDHELYAQFGDTESTLTYIANLFNYVGGIYEQEMQTQLLVGDTFLWTTAASQPWVENDDTACRLYEFGRYWRDYRQSVERTIAHFLSGRPSWGGIAWQDVLCQGTWEISAPTGCDSLGNVLVGGDFGVSGGLNGTISTSGGIAWDAIVVAHEIGHNFNSPHTHCYGGIDDHSSPVDACYAGEPDDPPWTGTCWSDAVSLPGMGSLTGGVPGERQGTIMSYCQLRSGGLGNVAGTLGRDHPFGVAADRVPNLMFNTVAAAAAANPACIPVVGSIVNHNLTVFRAGAGTGTVTSDPAGIDCGTSCSTEFSEGSLVILSAVAEPGSDFAGWSGEGCSGTDTCTVTMSSARSVTATFEMPPMALSNGVPVHELAGAEDSERFFTIEVPEGATNLVVTTGGGTGDVDLYLRFEAAPTLDDHDCQSVLPGTNETCDIAEPDAGTYHIMLHGWSAYSGVTLEASFEVPGTCGYNDDVVLSDTVLSGTQTHGACRVLSAGPSLIVGNSADVTFVAGERVLLRPGFGVEPGARLRAFIDPTLRP